MSKIYASEFSRNSGYPLALIKRLCNQGVIPYIPVGRKYLLDSDAVTNVLEQYSHNQDVKILKTSKQENIYPRRSIRTTRVVDGDSFLERLNNLKKEQLGC